MKKLLILLILALPVCFIQNTEAQNLGKYMEKKMKQASRRAANKADEEVTEEMNKQVDKSVEKVFDNIFSDDEAESNDTGSSKDTTKQTTTQKSDKATTPDEAESAMAGALLKSMGITTGTANFEDSYSYSGNIKMSVQTWDEGGESEGEIDYITYINKDNSGFAMEFSQDNQHSVMIFDIKNTVMIVLTQSDGEKTGMATDYTGESEWEEEEYDYEDYEEVDDFSIYNDQLKKTGRTKTIAGYKCDEYRFEDELSEGSMWMTNQLPPELWARMFSTNVLSAASAGYYGGFVMEMEEKSKEDSSRSFVQVQEVNQNQSKSLSTKGYNIVNFGFNPEMYENSEEE